MISKIVRRKSLIIGICFVFLFIFELSLKADNALHFDGKDDYVDIPQGKLENIGGPITIEFWNYVKTDEVWVARSAFGWTSLKNPVRVSCHAPWGDRRLYWDYGNLLEKGRLFTDYTPYLNKWTHIALVSEGKGGKFQGIYINGNLVAQKNISDGPNSPVNGLCIGRGIVNNQGGFAYHRGSIASFRIWNRVRTAEEIRGSMNSILVGNENGLVCDYDFNQGIPNSDNQGVRILPDYGPSGWYGILMNGDNTNWVSPAPSGLVPPPVSRKSLYAIEMFGMRGLLSFKDNITNNPTTAHLTLFGLTLNDIKLDIALTSGRWDSGRLRFSNLTINLWGSIQTGNMLLAPDGKSPANINANFVTNDRAFHPGTGYPLHESQQLLPPISRDTKYYVTAIAVNNCPQCSWDMVFNDHRVKGDDFRLLEIVIDKPGKKVTLYNLPNSVSITDKSQLSSYIVKEISLDSLIDFFPSSPVNYEVYWRPALARLVYEVMVKYPSQHFGFKYTGHGSAYMSLEVLLWGDQDNFYKNVNAIWGGKIDFLDFSTNCNTGSLYNLIHQTPYTDYILACDLLWWCDGLSVGDNGNVLPDRHYSTYWSRTTPIETSLRSMIVDVNSLFNSDVVKQFLQNTDCPQQLSLFKASEFPALLNGAPNLAKQVTKDQTVTDFYQNGNLYADLKDYLSKNYPGQIAQYDKLVIAQANNRASYPPSRPWSIPAKGICILKWF